MQLQDNQTNLKNDLNQLIQCLKLATRDLFVTFYETDKSTEVITGILSDNFYNSIEDSLKYIDICSTENSSLLMSSYQNYLDIYLKEVILIFVLCLIIIFITIIFCVKPFLNSLNQDIWKTKGMLNLIPTSVIYQYPSLKRAFADANLLFKQQ